MIYTTEAYGYPEARAAFLAEHAKFREALLVCQRRAYTAMDLAHEAYVADVLGVESLTAIDAEKATSP